MAVALDATGGCVWGEPEARCVSRMCIAGSTAWRAHASLHSVRSMVRVCTAAAADLPHTRNPHHACVILSLVIKILSIRCTCESVAGRQIEAATGTMLHDKSFLTQEGMPSTI